MTLQRLLGRSLDQFVLEGMIRLVRGGDYVVTRQEGEGMLSECGLGDPCHFFPPLSVEPAREVETRLLEQHPRYTVSQWRVPSPIAEAAPPNDLFGVRCFTPRRGLRGRVIILHGAMMSTYFP